MSDQQLHKEERVRRRRDYLVVQRRGEKLHLQHLLAFVRAGRGRSRRIGITVSKKVGGAVVRNRLKRLLREVWRCNKQCLPEGYDIVLIAKRHAAEACHADLERQVRQLGRRLARRAGLAEAADD